jgi:hypothetical protein
LPKIGNASFAVDVLRTETFAPTAFLLGVMPASVPLGPCTMRVDPALLLAIGTVCDATGFASLPLAIPDSGALLGASLYLQNIGVRPPPELPQWWTTPLLTLTIGS